MSNKPKAKTKKGKSKPPAPSRWSVWSAPAREWWEVVSGKRSPLTPPVRLLDEARIGSGDYDAVGTQFLKIFQEIGGLQPHHRVLDIGCGYGRMAKPLTAWLDPSRGGSYVGFDVFPKSVRWASRAFGSRHPHFRFHHLNIRNQHYNPSGTESDTTVRLPYPDGSFDFIFLTSIFTHLFPAAADHYISEIARLLSPEGRCLSTFFLLDDETRRLISEGRTTVKFRHTDPAEGWMALDKEDPERCIAFPVEQVVAWHGKHGLAIDEPIRLGNWCERAQPYNFQDIIVSRRIPSAV
jgi:SAM-dependent methyltransferase